MKRQLIGIAVNPWSKYGANVVAGYVAGLYTVHNNKGIGWEVSILSTGLRLTTRYSYSCAMDLAHNLNNHPLGIQLASVTQENAPAWGRLNPEFISALTVGQDSDLPDCGYTRVSSLG